MIQALPFAIPTTKGVPVLIFKVLVENGTSQFTDYVFSQQQQEQEKIIDFLEQVETAGIPKHNPEHYKKLHRYADLHELKKKPHRLVFAIIQSDIVFVWAFRKSGSERENDKEYAQADQLMQAYKYQLEGKK